MAIKKPDEKKAEYVARFARHVDRGPVRHALETIVVRDVYKPEPVKLKKPAYQKRGRKLKYTDDQVREVRRLSALGFSRSYIAERMKINPHWVSSVISGVLRSDVE